MYFDLFQVDKQDGLASIQEDEVSPRRENYQEKREDSFYPSSSPPTQAFCISSANEDEEGEEVVFPSILGCILKRNSRDEEGEVAFPSISSKLKKSQNSRDQEGDVALELALAALKRHSRDKSLLSISSSDLSSSSCSDEEEEELEFLVERGDRSLPESPASNSNEWPESSSYKEEVRERKETVAVSSYSCTFQWKDF